MDPRVRTFRHDLRNQLNSIVLCASVLPITDDPKEKLQFVDEIILAAERGMNILDQIDAFLLKPSSTHPLARQPDPYPTGVRIVL